MNDLTENKIKVQKARLMSQLQMAFCDLPKGHSVSMNISDSLIMLSDWARFVEGTDNHILYMCWVNKPGEGFSPNEFCNGIEIMISMIQSKMEVAA